MYVFILYRLILNYFEILKYFYQPNHYANHTNWIIGPKSIN